MRGWPVENRQLPGARPIVVDGRATTALCSPTRQALLTGRNHHSVGMGGVTEIPTSAPGNSSIRPKNTAPLGAAASLHSNEYREKRRGS